MSPPAGVSAAPRLEPGSRVQYLHRIGPQRARDYERLGIVTLEHLLRHYPRTWLDARRFVPIGGLKPGELLTVEATVRSAAAVRTRSGRSDLVVALEDGTGTLGCTFFGQPFLARTLRRGVRVVVSGELDPFEHRMTNPMFEVVEGDIEALLHVGRLVPVHALTRGLTARAMRLAVREAIDAAAERVPDPLPADLRAALALPDLGEALRDIHFPADPAALERARDRLAFEELFLVQMVLALRRRAFAEGGEGLVTSTSGELARRAAAALPWPLTAGQQQALAEIVADMARREPMQRMLLGDVGSGKTVVAFLAALHALEAGHQVAFMAPTEILARQHAATLARLAAPVEVRVAAWTGATPAAERRALAAELERGTPLVLVGTHALLEEKVKLPQLGLAIVDEQHRFGVRQRARLARKGVIPDVLVMTATPIPRTLMLACYGDLAVSLLRERPAGRGRLVTRITGDEKFPQVLEFMARELGAGRQAFVVVPMIEEGGRMEARAAEAEHRRLAASRELAAFTVGLLHGKLPAEEKQRTMAEFAAGRIQALVTTTVVEVGVDVPNATLMVIESADRFGLTQLHQLRGRVGRGEARSVCVLVPGATAGAQAHERLGILAGTEDGFEIAEADLRLRGPGELWGTRQSGLPRFRLADPVRDADRLEQAREQARARVEADPSLTREANADLRAALLAGFREPLELSLGA